MTDQMLPPNSIIGILGGGQLGRMLAIAAAKLGFKVHIFEPDAPKVSIKPPAAEVAHYWTQAAYDDEAALIEFAKSCDVITYEFENVPVSAAKIIVDAGGLLRPGIAPLEIAQDRLNEKKFANDLSTDQLQIETAAFMPVASVDALGLAIAKTGLPAIMKTRRMGYDGKGQAVIKSEDDAIAAHAELGGEDGRNPLILEGFVDFEKEISIIAARDIDGHVICFDPPENLHKDGILYTSTVPARISVETQKQAMLIADQFLNALDYVGVLTVELFVEPDGKLRVNEIAPRVHNSGHWTVEACGVSQFEQHIRAVAGWPLADVDRHHDCVMQNLIGAEADDWAEIAARDKTYLTLYGKTESRAGRKMGHFTQLR